jgi:hypothetical protein
MEKKPLNRREEGAQPMEEPSKSHGDKIKPHDPKPEKSKPDPVTPEQQGGIAGP